MDYLSIFSVKPQQYSGSHLDHYRPLAVPIELSIALEQLNKTASSVGFYTQKCNKYIMANCKRAPGPETVSQSYTYTFFSTYPRKLII